MCSWFSCAWLAAGLSALLAPARAASDESDALFVRVKTHMAEHRARLPNYTCHETVDRMLRAGSQWRYLDRLELEVAFAGRQEIFSRPGSESFGKQTVEEIAGGGTIGNGAMGSHTDFIIFQEGIEFKYAGKGKKDGRRAIRYDFHVPIEESHFRVRHNGAEGMAGYDGSVWFDDASLDPVRVDLKVNRIPSYIGVRHIEESLHYRSLTIGDAAFDLPDHSELTATDEANNNTVNITKLSQCRQFVSDSTVTYAMPKQNAAPKDGHR